MTVSQQLNHVNENLYDDDITITDIPQGNFPAVIANNFTEGSTTREISVSIMPLEQAPGGTINCNTGIFPKGSGETTVKVTVKDINGSELATNTANY